MKSYFPKKTKVHFYPPLTFNKNDVKKCPNQKYLGIMLDSKLDFNIHVDSKTKKCYKLIGIIKRLSVSVREKLYSPSTNPSSDHIWTIEIYCTINQKIKIFKINKKKFNIKHVLQ